MPRLAIHPSATIADFLRQRRQELGLSLREVQERTAALGESIPFTTLARVEQGKVDPGLRRLHLLLRLYHVPLELAGDLLDLEEFSGAWPEEETDPEVLSEEGVKHWKAGDTRKGMAYLFALRTQTAKDAQSRVRRQKGLLYLAIAAGSLGKYRLSREILDGLLLEPPDPSLLVQVLIQTAVSWHRLGSAEAALAFLGRADHHVEARNRKHRAWIHHEKAGILATLGSFKEAEAELKEALKHYKQAADPYCESRALGVAVRIRMDQGNPAGALSAARIAREHARRHGFERLRIMRRLDEGRAQVALGDNAAGLSALAEGLSAGIAAQDYVIEFYAHYYLWKAYLSVGDGPRAEAELRATQHYVRFVDDATPETAEIRRMAGPGRRRRHGTRRSSDPGQAEPERRGESARIV